MDMFVPELSLQKESDGEYTLNAMTLTPNGCFSGAFTSLGAPAGHVTIPEAQAVTLQINRTGQICTLAVTPVHHSTPNLKVGLDHGKTSIVAFAEVHDLDTGSVKVVGESSIEVPAPSSTTLADADNPRPGLGQQWHALANLKPPAPFSLFVHGKVTVPHPGHLAELRVAEPQGINPRILILDLVIENLPGNWPQVVTQIDAQYHDGAYPDDLHDQVTIRADCGTSWLATIQKVF